MPKRNLLVLVVTAAILLVLLTGCSSDNSTTLPGEKELTPSSDNQLTAEQLYFRTDNGEGGVQVGVLWAAPEYFRLTNQEELITELDLEDNLVFEISMTTHSGDLSNFPVLEKTQLTVDGVALKPIKWEVLSNSSHHPAGMLFFPAKDEDGNPVLKANSVIELNLKDLKGIPDRKFVWKLPL